MVLYCNLLSDRTGDALIERDAGGQPSPTLSQIVMHRQKGFLQLIRLIAIFISAICHVYKLINC